MAAPWRSAADKFRDVSRVGIIDTETTGVGKEAQLLEIGAGIYDPAQLAANPKAAALAEFHTLVHPDPAGIFKGGAADWGYLQAKGLLDQPYHPEFTARVISPEIQHAIGAINKINLSTIFKEGVPRDVATQQLQDFLGRNPAQALTGYHAAFDKGILEKSGFQSSVPWMAEDITHTAHTALGVPHKYLKAQELGTLMGMGTETHRALEDVGYEAEILGHTLQGGEVLEGAAKKLGARAAIGKVAREAAPEVASGFFKKYPGVGTGLAITGTVLALHLIKPFQILNQRISSRDDDYNTIEGLSHKGIAQHMRHGLTDFGSGFKRGTSSVSQEISLGMFQQPLAMTVNTEQLHQKLGEIVGQLRDKKSEISRYATESQRGEILHLHHEVGEAIRGGHKEFIVVNRDWKRTVEELTPGDRYTNAEAFRTLKSNLFHERGHQAVTKLGIREQISKSGMAPRRWQESTATQAYANIPGMPNIIPEESMMNAMAERRYPGSTMRTLGPELRFNPQEVEIITNKAKELGLPVHNARPIKAPRVKLPVAPTIRALEERIPAKIAANTIEALGHKGISKFLRRILTSFGSGWRGLEEELAHAMNRGFNKRLASITTRSLEDEAPRFLEKFVSDTEKTGATDINRLKRIEAKAKATSTHHARLIENLKAERKAIDIPDDISERLENAKKLRTARWAQKHGLAIEGMEEGVPHTDSISQEGHARINAQIEEFHKVKAGWSKKEGLRDTTRTHPRRVQSNLSGHKFDGLHPGKGKRFKGHTFMDPKDFGSAWLGMVDDIALHPELITTPVSWIEGPQYPIMSGDDDRHNTIEGLSHTGLAGTMRYLQTDFGSGFKGKTGMIQVGKDLIDFLGERKLGLTGDTKALQKKFKSFISSAGLGGGAAKRALPARRSAANKLWNDILEAKKAGHKAIIVLNEGAIEEAAITHNVSKNKVLKHVISHEDVHHGPRSVGGVATGELLPGFESTMIRRNYNAGWKQSYYEEQLAHLHSTMKSKMFMDPTEKNLLIEYLGGSRKKLGYDLEAAKHWVKTGKASRKALQREFNQASQNMVANSERNALMKETMAAMQTNAHMLESTSGLLGGKGHTTFTNRGK